MQELCSVFFSRVPARGRHYVLLDAAHVICAGNVDVSGHKSGVSAWKMRERALGEDAQVMKTDARGSTHSL